MSGFDWLCGRKVRLAPEDTARLEAWRAKPPPAVEAPLAESRVVVVDVESSGLDARRDRLIAIGAVAVTRWQIRLDDAFESVLQQGEVSGRENILIHGIGGAAQRAGVPPAEALLSFLDFVGQSPLIAFHAAFDEAMIARAMRTFLGLRFRHAWADLAYVAPAVLPRLAARHRTLDDWMAAFEIRNYARHSALADAFATAELLLALRPALTARGVTRFAGLRGLERERRRLVGG